MFPESIMCPQGYLKIEPPTLTYSRHVQRKVVVFSDMQFASAGGDSAVLRSVQKRYKTRGWSLGELCPSRLMFVVGTVIGIM